MKTLVTVLLRGAWPMALLGISLLVGACSTAAAGSPSGSGSGSGSEEVQQVTVQMSEFKFVPAAVTVKVNEPVRVTAKNVGSVDHDWTVQGLGTNVQALAKPGASTTVEFTPNRTGTFRVVCTQPGHEQAGMVAQLIVK